MQKSLRYVVGFTNLLKSEHKNRSKGILKGELFIQNNLPNNKTIIRSKYNNCRKFTLLTNNRIMLF